MQILFEAKAFEEYNDWARKHRNVAELWLKGIQSFNELDEIDKHRYISSLVWWLVFYENVFYQWKNGLLDKKSYKPWANSMEDLIKQHQFEQFWDSIKNQYQIEFSEYITKLVAMKASANKST